MRVQVERLAGIGCTHREIAAVVGLSEPTLRKYYTDVIEDGAERGKASFRRIQLKSAQEGNATMLVWLGKTWLKQTETIVNEHRYAGMSEDDIDAKIAQLSALLGHSREN